MKMTLDEALETLKKAGMIAEGSMSLEDKIANAKKFNKPSKADVLEMIKDLNNGQCGSWKFRLDGSASDYFSIIGENDDWYDDEERIDQIEWVWYLEDCQIDIYYGKQKYGDALDNDTAEAFTVQELMDVIRDDKYV